jgi:GTP cyclohydrolase IA
MSSEPLTLDESADARSSGGLASSPATDPAERGRAARPTSPRPALRVVPEAGLPDLRAAEAAAAAFLTALGVPLTGEARAASPGRMARAWAEMLTPRPFDLTTFPNDEGYDSLVLARSLPVQSVCEHHLLPFTGVAHVGYLPGDRILGLSKLARVVELFAHGAQVQERLTKQIADWLDLHLRPRGVGVVIEAEHLCMSLRGVQAAGTRTMTSTLLGRLRDDGRSRAEFFALAGLGAH